MISKKLLEAILGYKTSDDCGKYKKTISTYELANKVKQWAWNNKFWIDSGKHRIGWFANCGYLVSDSKITNKFYAKTEPEAIFKAGEWILSIIKKSK